MKAQYICPATALAAVSMIPLLAGSSIGQPTTDNDQALLKDFDSDNDAITINLWE